MSCLVSSFRRPISLYRRGNQHGIIPREQAPGDQRSESLVACPRQTNLFLHKDTPTGPVREHVPDAAYAAKLPLGHIGRPEEVAAVFAFLASEDTSFITGDCIVVVDGESRRRPAFSRFVAAGRMSSGLAADDGVGLEFVGTELARVVSSRRTARAYRVTADHGEALETAIEPDYLDA
jgi:Enoyl-(Acyl carrier protein) reductase